MENLSYLFAAYSVTWVVLFIYIFSLWRRQGRIEAELQALKTRIEGEGTPKE